MLADEQGKNEGQRRHAMARGLAGKGAAGREREQVEQERRKDEEDDTALLRDRAGSCCRSHGPSMLGDGLRGGGGRGLRRRARSCPVEPNLAI